MSFARLPRVVFSVGVTALIGSLTVPARAATTTAGSATTTDASATATTAARKARGRGSGTLVAAGGCTRGV